MNPPDEIWSFPTRCIGRKVLYYHTITSTNDAAARAVHETEGTAFVADEQTAGRGQQGRTWFGPANETLLVSILLKPPPELTRPVILTALAAVAIGDAIHELSGLQTRIKWPNDLLIRGKKVCGILIEQSRGTVIGIGLNLNQSGDDFARARLPDAASLAGATGTRFDRRAALDAVLRRLDVEYERLRSGERVPLEADWKWRIGLLGRRVMIERVDGTYRAGRLVDMTFDGIELRTEAGTADRILPEEIRHLVAV